jgi:membrane fusion protein, multidrug efflux system
MIRWLNLLALPFVTGREKVVDREDWTTEAVRESDPAGIWKPGWVSVLVFVALSSVGCKKQAETPAKASGGGFSVQVVAVPVRQQPVVETISLVGSIAPNETVDLKAETDGIVREISFAEGQHVNKGDALVLLDETKLAAQLAESEAYLSLAKASFDRVQQLLRDKLISQQEYDQAAANFATTGAGVDLKRRLLKDARVIAPFAGIVAARQISPGQVITRNSLIATLVDLDVVKVEINVPERYLSQLKEGQTVEFKVAAYPKETFKGEVYFISPQLDIGTRTALVKARIPNGQTRLRAGMFANLDLALQLRDSALVIPEPALISNGDATMVFTVDSATNALMKTVKLGIRLAGKAEVLSGLTVGERVIVEGIQKLQTGVPLRFAPPEAAAPYLN